MIFSCSPNFTLLFLFWASVQSSSADLAEWQVKRLKTAEQHTRAEGRSFSAVCSYWCCLLPTTHVRSSPYPIPIEAESGSLRRGHLCDLARPIVHRLLTRDLGNFKRSRARSSSAGPRFGLGRSRRNEDRTREESQGVAREHVGVIEMSVKLG